MENLQPGDLWPTKWASSRGLVGRPCDPVWHALVVRPQSERNASDRLRNAGVIVRYPTFTNIRHIRGVKREIIRPAIPSLIYAQFRYEPNWDVLKDRRVIWSFMGRNGAPIALHDDDIARVMGLPTEAERIERERMAALLPQPGEQADVTAGPFTGLCVDVERVAFGRVWWSMINGMRGEGPVDQFVRRKSK